MEKNRFTLEYLPTSMDLSKYTDKYRTFHPRGPFLTADHDGYGVHGNSYIIVKENDLDVSGNYSTWRFWRLWRLAPGDNLNPIGPPENNWEDDNLADDNGKRRSNWLDVPGYLMVIEPKKWEDERHMLEFVVSVDGHTAEANLLYFYVIVSLKPEQYRIQMSRALSSSFKKWREISATRKPWAGPSLSITVDSLWRSAEASKGASPGSDE